MIKGKIIHKNVKAKGNEIKRISGVRWRDPSLWVFVGTCNCFSEAYCDNTADSTISWILSYSSLAANHPWPGKPCCLKPSPSGFRE